MVLFSYFSRKPVSTDSEKSPLMHSNVQNIKKSSHNDDFKTSSHSSSKHNDDDGNDSQQQRLSFAQLRPFFKIAIPYFRNNRSALCTLCALLILTIMDSFFEVAFSYTKRNLLNALGT